MQQGEIITLMRTSTVEKTANVLTDMTRLLTVKELCVWWKCSKKYIWSISVNCKSDNRLPSYKVGKHRLYKYDECCWYLQKQEAI